MLTYRQATPEDAISLATRLRKADLLELQAVGRSSPEEALLFGFSVPDPCVYVAVDEEDTPQIIGGVHPSGDEILGFAWMMASDALKQHWRQILRDTRPMLEKVRGKHQVLANAVHAENHVHIRWLQWAGFIFLRECELNGHRFYEFAKLFQQENQHV